MVLDTTRYNSQIDYGVTAIYAHYNIKDGPSDETIKTFAVWESPYGYETQDDGHSMIIDGEISNEYYVKESNGPLKKGTYMVTIYNDDI